MKNKGIKRHAETLLKKSLTDKRAHLILDLKPFRSYELQKNWKKNMKTTEEG